MEFIAQGLLRFDQEVFLLINQKLHFGLLDPIMRFLSDPPRFLWIPIVCIAGLLVLFAAGPRARTTAILAVLAVSMADPIAYRLMKPVVGRKRPNHPDYLVAQGRFSFGYNRSLTYPSNHAANAAAAARIVSFAFPYAGWVGLGICLAVGCSRVYLGQHFPLDILGGFLLGILLAEILNAVFVRFPFPRRNYR